MRARLGHLGLACLVLLLQAATCLAGGSLSIREVEAKNDGSGVPANLQNIAAALKSSMPFTGYRLLSSHTLPLPADGEVQLSSGYRLRCSGAQKNLEIVVERNRSEVLRTTASLRDGKPLVLGGLSGAGGRVLLIFLVQ